MSSIHLPQDRINSGVDVRPRWTRRARLLAWPAFFLALLCFVPRAAISGIPDLSQSFYVPQSGTVAAPAEGALAFRFFRACPNNDGGTSLPNNARIKVVVRDPSGNGIPDIAAADICIMFNGGTPAQGFGGIGADSIIANSAYNTDPLCPDVRCIPADAPTDANGTTYITFTGATPGSPGVGTRDPNRKWGHYDSELPVNVLGFNLSGRLTTASLNGTYVLRIKNFDIMEGLGVDTDEGAAVTTADFSAIARHIGVADAISYWLDFDSSGAVTAIDFNALSAHMNHDCDTPNSP